MQTLLLVAVTYAAVVLRLATIGQTGAALAYVDWTALSLGLWLQFARAGWDLVGVVLCALLLEGISATPPGVQLVSCVVVGWTLRELCEQVPCPPAVRLLVCVAAGALAIPTLTAVLVALREQQPVAAALPGWTLLTVGGATLLCASPIALLTDFGRRPRESFRW